MINGSNEVSEKTILKAFESGFSNAAISFSQLVNSKVSFDNFHTGYIDFKLSSTNLHERYQHYNGFPRYLLTTEVFGDIGGKSYLFFSQQDFEVLTKAVPDMVQGTLNLREEFIKELDNILSAAVITKLSNDLNHKMFGDVPLLVGKVSARLEDVIYDDFGEQNDQVYINSISFSFENLPHVNPLFVWVFDTKLLNDVQTKAVE